MKKILLLVSSLLIICMAGSAMAEGINLVSDAPTTDDGSSIEAVPGSILYLSTQFWGYPTEVQYNYVSGKAVIEKPHEAARDATPEEVTVTFERNYFKPTTSDSLDDNVVKVVIGPESLVPIGSNIVVTVVGQDNKKCYINLQAVQRITTVPEFPTVALPIAALIGLVFIFGRKKEEM
jgi:acetylornithine deacetylase/succinyl-diaminopimelate desuccinylase-like protein